MRLGWPRWPLRVLAREPFTEDEPAEPLALTRLADRRVVPPVSNTGAPVTAVWAESIVRSGWGELPTGVRRLPAESRHPLQETPSKVA
jgi:hypothetical protein